HPPAATAIYTLSLHDALPISTRMRIVGGSRDVDRRLGRAPDVGECGRHPLHQPQFDRCAADVQIERILLCGWSLLMRPRRRGFLDRKSTRLNSSHVEISYAVF